MKVSQTILEDAREIVEKGLSLPARLPSFPSFYVGSGDDKTISVHAAIEVEGKSFVIGGIKNRNLP